MKFPSVVENPTLRRAVWVFAALVAIALFFLAAEHGAHFRAILPFLLLIGCALMHVFMHGGHGGHGSSQPREPEAARVPENEART